MCKINNLCLVVCFSTCICAMDSERRIAEIKAPAPVRVITVHEIEHKLMLLIREQQEERDGRARPMLLLDPTERRVEGKRPSCEQW